MNNKPVERIKLNTPTPCTGRHIFFFFKYLLFPNLTKNNGNCVYSPFFVTRYTVFHMKGIEIRMLTQFARILYFHSAHC